MKKFYKKLFAAIAVLIVFFAGSPLITAQTVQVTFKVDMSEVETLSPNGIHIAGSFQGWDPSATIMIPPPFGSYYTYTATLTPGETILWKYVNGTTWGEVENLVGAGLCVTGNDNNRVLVVPEQDVTLNVVCFGSCNVCNPPIVDITFRVDMSNEQVSPSGVHVAGSFQGWNPGSTEMLPEGNGVYAVTLPLGAGDYYEYKFINGVAWANNETVPPDCATGGNRYIEIPNVTSTLEAVCFGSCYACGPPPVDVEVTFNVDMSGQTISANGVHLGAGFQGWDPGATLMSDQGDGIYSFTAILSSGSYQEYKFVNGITWDDAEFLPEECSNNGNRYFTVPDVNTIMDTVCYSLCGPCPLPVEANVTFQVDMSEQEVSANGVHLIGSFNDYDPTATAMTLQRNGIYETTIVLTENEQHTYKFVNGNELSGEETVPAECAQEDGYRVVDIPGVDLIIDDVCFGACEPCVPPPTVDIVFYVDMSNEIVSDSGVYLAGSFNSFNAGASEMADIGDNVFKATVNLEVGTHVIYKFLNGNSFDGEEDVPESCGENDGFGGYNRYFDVTDTTNILDVVCFSSCTECVVPVEVEVTFLVDMQNKEIDTAGVYIAGSFQGWNTTSSPMTLLEDQVYKFTTTLTAGENHEYKFLNGNTLEGYELIPEECASSNGNRYYTVQESADTIPLVCFGACTECIPPAEVNITFQVDMTEQEVSANGVHLIGSFNDYDPTATEMTLLRDGIYAASLTLTENDQHSYKFVNGNELSGEETVPEECANIEGYRIVDIPGEDLVLENVCFAACGPCIPPPTANVIFSVDMSNEEVSSEGLFIVGTFQDWTLAATAMTLTENNIYTYTTALVVGDSIEFKYMNGITWDDAEIISGECTNGGGNRYLIIPEEDLTLDLVCFGTCTACVAPVEVTFLVDMQNVEIDTAGVFIAGSFQGWNTTSDQMTLTGDATYSYTATILPGDYHEYKFINGTTTNGYEVVPAGCASNDGNRYLTVPDTATVLELVCFSSCEACLLPVDVDVLFQVDMSEQEVSENGVHLIGSFNEFDPTATEMTLLRNGIYEATLVLTENDQHTYKFVNGNELSGAETVPGECAQGDGYRVVDIPGVDLIIDDVCFGACGPCIPPPTVNVTFFVDMSNEEVSFDRPHLAGSFNSFDPSVALMEDLGDNIYAITLPLVVGEHITYKYINGTSFDFVETVPAECGEDDTFGGFNRFLDVPETDTLLVVVCFSSCTACIAPVPVEVTFQVDMSNQIVSPEGVFVAGSFNEYNASATQMTLMGGGIYAVTLTLVAGDNHQYKYLNGPSYDYQESVPEACGVPDGYDGFNRALLVEETDQVTDLVCFSACDACNREHNITLFAGWNSLSSYRLPDDTNIVALMSQIENELVVMQTMTDVYFPDGGLNTLVDWGSQSAYKIKVTDDVSLNITGIIEQSKTLQLEAGWNLIPVLSDQPMNVETLFANVIADVVVIKEIADVGIFWPFYNINTLGSMQTGKAYFVKMTAPGEITFP